MLSVNTPRLCLFECKNKMSSALTQLHVTLLGDISVFSKRACTYVCEHIQYVCSFAGEAEVRRVLQTWGHNCSSCWGEGGGWGLWVCVMSLCVFVFVFNRYDKKREKDDACY